MGNEGRLQISVVDIEAPGREPSWLPETYRWALARLIDAGDGNLAESTMRARTLVAREIAAAFFQRPVTGAHLTTTGRVVAALQGGGTNGCLLLAWFDIDGDVHAIELDGIWQATHWILSPDGRHVTVIDKQAQLVETDIEESSGGVVWRPPPGMRSYSYDYTDDDHILIVADFHGRAPEAHLLRRGDDEQFTSVAMVGDVACQDVTWVAPFAFLDPGQGPKRAVLGVRGDRLAHLGTCLFPSPPWDLAELDGRIVYTTKSTVHRVDGLFEALDGGAAPAPAAAVAARPALQPLDRVIQLQERLRGVRLGGGDQPYTALRERVFEHLGIAEGAFGWYLADVPSRTEAELAAMPAHTLIVWMTDAAADIWLFAVPESAIDARQAAALDRAGGVFAGPEDFEGHEDDWDATAVVMAALGFDDVHEEAADDPAWQAWRPHQVKRAADLDRRFTRVCSLRLAM
jgi:hypothetical protein